MNRLQADLKKGLFAEGEKAWDKHKTKLGLKTSNPDHTSTPQPPPPQVNTATSSSTPSSSIPIPTNAPLPETTTSVPTAPITSMPPAPPTEPIIEQPAPTPTNSTVAPPVETEPQEKQNMGGKLKDKLMAKLQDPKVQEKAEAALKKEAKKKFFGFKF